MYIGFQRCACNVMLPRIMKSAIGLTWREDLQQLQKIMRLHHQLLRNNWCFIIVLCYLLLLHKICISRWIWTSGLPKSSNEALSPSWGLKSTIVAHAQCSLLLNNVRLLAPSWGLRSSGHSTEHCILCILPSRVRNLSITLFCSGSWARRSRVCWRRSRRL